MTTALLAVLCGAILGSVFSLASWLRWQSMKTGTIVPVGKWSGKCEGSASVVLKIIVLTALLALFNPLGWWMAVTLVVMGLVCPWLALFLERRRFATDRNLALVLSAAEERMKTVPPESRERLLSEIAPIWWIQLMPRNWQTKWHGKLAPPGFQRIVELWHERRILIGVDRVYAKHFFMKTPVSVFREKAGVEPWVHKAVIWLLWICSPVALLAAFVLAWDRLGWWALAIMPVATFIWVMYRGMSCAGGARTRGISLMLGGAVVWFVLSASENRPWASLAVTFLASLWCSRLLYSYPTAIMRRMVLMNHRAFYWLEGELTCREVE